MRGWAERCMQAFGPVEDFIMGRQFCWVGNYRRDGRTIHSLRACFYSDKGECGGRGNSKGNQTGEKVTVKEKSPFALTAKEILLKNMSCGEGNVSNLFDRLFRSHIKGEREIFRVDPILVRHPRRYVAVEFQTEKTANMAAESFAKRNPFRFRWVNNDGPDARGVRKIRNERGYLEHVVRSKEKEVVEQLLRNQQFKLLPKEQYPSNPSSLNTEDTNLTKVFIEDEILLSTEADEYAAGERKYQEHKLKQQKKQASKGQAPQHSPKKGKDTSRKTSGMGVEEAMEKTVDTNKEEQSKKHE